MSANHFVNNKTLYLEFIKYKEAYNKAIESNQETPRLPDTIGRAIWEISNRYARKKNFYFLRFKEEMVGDAIELCVRYAHNFDPDKTKNPFGYLTMVVHNAFLQRIAKEKRQEILKKKYIKKVFLEGILEAGDTHVANQFIETLQKYSEENDLANDKFDRDEATLVEAATEKDDES